MLISRGSLPGWLSSGALVLGIVGYFFYERASDEKWMALEQQSFDRINDSLDDMNARMGRLEIELAEHRGRHAVGDHLPIPPRDRHP